MNSFDLIRVLCNTSPKAYALITGATVTGTMLAYSFEEGTIVVVEAQGLPATGCGLGVHGLHIHEGSSCSGTPENPFGNAGGHYSTTNCPHPYHTGDLPLFLPPIHCEIFNLFPPIVYPKFAKNTSNIVHFFTTKTLTLQ